MKQLQWGKTEEFYRRCKKTTTCELKLSALLFPACIAVSKQEIEYFSEYLIFKTSMMQEWGI